MVRATVDRMPNDAAQIIFMGQRVLRTEQQALERAEARLGQSFADAVSAVMRCQGNVVVVGVGKSYFIAQKISASMASTGTPSIAMHPVDAVHGDLGRLRHGDVVIALSNSGATNEVLSFMRAVSRMSLTRIAVTCHAGSSLARLSDIVIDLGPLDEACHMGVAPSTTTTAMLAMGDALTLVLAELRGFTLEAFAQFHPGGSLGKRLQAVEVAMRPLDSTAVVTAEQSVLQVLEAITLKRCGAAYVVDAEKKLLGIFTDGDLRRLIANGAELLGGAVEQYMVRAPKRVVTGTLVDAALQVMRQHQVDELPVLDAYGVLLGHLDIQDLTE